MPYVFVCLVDRQCYGGDVSRKKKLLQKQAKGKKRMKALGKVIVPQEAFQVGHDQTKRDCSHDIASHHCIFSQRAIYWILH